MQASSLTIREKYIAQVRSAEAELKLATSDETNSILLEQARQTIDKLTVDYKDHEELGTARYKIYELQAFACYFEGNDSEAFSFINYAIYMKGSSYQRAEKLKSKLEKHDRRELKPKQGIRGWLLFYLITLYYPGIFIALIIVVVFGIYPISRGHNTPLVLLSLPSFLYGIVYVLNLIHTHKHRKIAVITNILLQSLQLLIGISLAIMGLLIGSSSSIGGGLGLMTWPAIWLVYFTKSKRVKSTFIK